MFRRLITLAAALALVAALAARRSPPRQGARRRQDNDDLRLDRAVADDRPERARRARCGQLVGEFYYHVSPRSALRRPDRALPGRRLQRLGYKVNGVSPPVGADQVAVKDGDTVLWYWATFSEQGSTPTLLSSRRAKANCYSVVSQNDRAATPAPPDAVFVRTASRQDAPGRPASVGTAAWCVDRAGRRALERPEVKHGGLVRLARSSCSRAVGGERAGSGSASLWVTRDRGATVLSTRPVPRG